VNRLAKGIFKDFGHARQMVWAIALGSALILVAVVVIVQQSVAHERNLAFDSALDINSKIALSDEVRIRSLLASLDKVLLVLRRDFVSKPQLTRQELLRRLEELQVDGELNPRISFVAASGDVRLSSAFGADKQSLTINVADRQYFQRQKDARDDLLDVGAPIQSRVSGQWVVPLTRRLLNPDGSFGGVISMTVDPGLFTDPFEKTSLGANATRAIIGLDGYTRLRLNAGKIIYGGDTRKSRLFDEIKKSKVGAYTAVAASDGIQRAVSYRVIDPYGIVILAGSSVDSIEASYRNKVRSYLIASCLFAALIVLLTGLFILGVLRQRQLFESQQSFNQLIELLPQLIFRLDGHGNILWVNSRTMEYVGPSSVEQATGFDWVVEAVHPEDRARFNDFVSSALLRHQNMESCEYRKRRFDGAYLWFTSQITRVLDEYGTSTSFLQTGTDIHDRKMAEERVRVTQKLESIGQLTGGMAHDFNNLLAIILGNLDLAKGNKTLADASRHIDVAISAAQRGVGLVKSLLALASKQPLMPATIDLWALVERVAPLLKHALGQRVNFELHSAGLGARVVVDEAGLEAVLLNLAVNARDAMPKGGNVTLSLEVTPAMARLAIRDNGTGMPEAVLKRATEPFFTTKERGHGTGLGLSMVAGFVKQSGGTLNLQSAEGQGTTIEIFLPLVTAAPVNVPVAVAARPALSPTIGKRRILVVDDEPALGQLLRAWADSHTVVVANSADDALTLLAFKAFDMLLTDIMMPGQLDGIGLAEKVAALYPATKILLMSGYSKETATSRADIPWPLLVKPFRKEDFEAAMEKAFSYT